MEEGGGGWEGEVTKWCGEGVGLRWKIWTLSCLFSRYIYKCTNTTVKQMHKFYISVLGGLYHSDGLAKYWKYTRLRNCEGVNIFRRKRCSGSNSKVCYSVIQFFTFQYCRYICENLANTKDDFISSNFIKLSIFQE